MRTRNGNIEEVTCKHVACRSTPAHIGGTARPRAARSTLCPAQTELGYGCTCRRLANARGFRRNKRLEVHAV